MRVRSLVVALAVLLGLLVPGGPVSATGGEPFDGTFTAEVSTSIDESDWPMFGRDALGTRANPVETVLSPASLRESGLRERWRFATAMPIYGTPAVAAGTVYAADMAGHVFALDATDGDLVWLARVGPVNTSAFVVTSSPLVTDELVVVGDHSGVFWALDRSTGLIRWTQRPNHFGYPAVWGSPSVATVQTSSGPRTLILAPVSSNEHTVAATPESPCCTSRGSLAALDPHTGEVVWQTYTITDEQAAQGSSGATIWTMPVYDAELNLVFIGTSNNYSEPATDTSDAVIALDAETGRIVWKNQRTEGDVWTIGNPEGPDADFSDSLAIYRLVNGRKVVAGGDKSGRMHVLRADDGALVSSSQVMPGGTHGGIWESAQVDGTIYAPGNDWEDYTSFGAPPPKSGSLVAIRANLPGAGSHKELWRFTREGTNMSGAAAVAGGVVYIHASREGVLYAIDAADGSVLAQADVGEAMNGPSISDGRVFIGVGDATGAASMEPGGALVALALGP